MAKPFPLNATPSVAMPVTEWYRAHLQGTRGDFVGNKVPGNMVTAEGRLGLLSVARIRRGIARLDGRMMGQN
jgi:hypothetical protein